MLDAFKRGNSGGKPVRQQADELQTLIAASREERAALSTMLTQIQLHTSKLATASKSPRSSFASALDFSNCRIRAIGAATGTGLGSGSKSTICVTSSGAAAPDEGRAVESCKVTLSQFSVECWLIAARRASSNFGGAVLLPVCKRAS